MANPKTGQSAGSPSTGDAKSSWGARVTSALGSAVNTFRPNFGKDTPMKGGSRITRLIMGTLIFVLVGQLLVTGLYALDSAFKLGLQQPISKSITWITPFFAIYFLLLIGLWFGLNKFGFFPRPEPLPPTSRGSSSGSSSDKKGVTQIPGIGGPRARSRHADTAAPATNGKKTAATPTKVAAKPSVTTSASGAFDDTYERVKAAQRQKRRRELR